MNAYRLVLVYQDGASEHTGVVICADDARAQAAARDLLDAHVQVRAVEIHDERGSVRLVERAAPVRAMAG